MNSRRAVARALVSVLAAATMLVTGSVGAPAQASDAYTPPVVSSPDTSTNGHVKGTVLTEAPYVRIALLDADSSAVLATTTVAAAAPAPYDFETMTSWTIEIRATACAAPDDCSGPSSTTGSLPATSVTARVTWPDQSYAVGAARTSYMVFLQDIGAGGLLEARWNGHTMPVASTGDVDVMSILAEDGQDDLTIERCSTTRADSACVPTGATPVSVWRHFYPTAKGGGTFSADGTSAPDGFGRYALGVWGATVTFDYTLRPIDQPDPVRSGSAIAASDGSDVSTVGVDLTGLPDGSYLLEGTFSFEAGPYGTITGTPQGPDVVITLDTQAPQIRGIAFDRSTVYPYPDGYQDTVSFHAVGDGTDTGITKATYDILDSTGHVVWTSTTTPPTGLTGDGGTWSPGSAPAGAYVVRATVRDAAGNTTVATSQPVILSRARLVQRHYYRLVTAKQSLVSRSVGRCSVLRSPSLRGWAGSLGLYSGARCSRQGAAATVRTVHRLRVPDDVLGGTATLYLNGGSSHARRSGKAWFGWRTKTGAWLPFSRAAWFTASHRDKGGAIAVADLADSGGYLTWGARVDSGSRYDVESFAVSIDYLVLR